YFFVCACPSMAKPPTKSNAKTMHREIKEKSGKFRFLSGLHKVKFVFILRLFTIIVIDERNGERLCSYRENKKVTKQVLQLLQSNFILCIVLDTFCIKCFLFFQSLEMN